jgi:DNA-binding transcriptional regulator LsrR (DeoR family)
MNFWKSRHPYGSYIARVSAQAEVARLLQISRTSVHRILTERLSHAHEED